MNNVLENYVQKTPVFPEIVNLALVEGGSALLTGWSCLHGTPYVESSFSVLGEVDHFQEILLKIYCC